MMTLSAVLVVNGLAVGMLATLFMDALNFLGAKTGLVGLFRPSILGRWVTGFTHGRYWHPDILNAPAIRCEFAVGELAHYTIGGTLGVLYVFLAGALSMDPRSFLFAVVYGIATNIFPWFILFPALGFGWFGRKGPPPMMPLRTSIYNHLNYGIGLAIFINLLSRL